MTVSLSLLTLWAALIAPGGNAAAAPTGERARPADTFVDSIGVNVHLHYTDTVYSRFSDIVEPRLAELGVRHIRDGAYTYEGISAGSFYYRRLRDLGQRGIRANLITAIDTRWGDRTRVALLDDIQQWTGGAVTSFEGANEPDLSGVGDWVAQTRGLQQDVWSKVWSDAALRDVDVVGPGVAWQPGALGDLSAWVDYGNWHAYPGGRCPTCADVYGTSFDSRVGAYRKPSGDKSLMITETGYHNAVTGLQDHRGVSEQAAGRYVPRLLFENYNRNIARTYLYELLDLRDDPAMSNRDHHFGLLRNDGSHKPAFIALRNTIALLSDAGPAFTPSSLEFSLDGETGEVHHTLLQKRDGHFYLALWQERSSYDTGERANAPDALSARRDINVPAQRVTVRLAQPMLRARLFAPGTKAGAVGTWTLPTQVTVDVPDEVVVLELTPLRAPTPPSGEAPATPPPGRSGATPPGRGGATPPAIDVSGTCAGIDRAGFADVPADHTFAAEIDCLHAWRVTRGSGSGDRFAPQRSLPRWQMAVFLHRLAGLSGIAADGPDNGAAPFKDIGSLSAEARRATTGLQRIGVVQGSTRVAFAPFEPVTRGQIAAFLQRLRRLVDGQGQQSTTDYFVDDDGNVHEADINALAGLGVVRGSGDRRYRPGAAVTRGQMAAILTRHLHIAVEAGTLDPAHRD